MIKFQSFFCLLMIGLSLSTCEKEESFTTVFFTAEVSMEFSVLESPRYSATSTTLLYLRTENVGPSIGRLSPAADGLQAMLLDTLDLSNNLVTAKAYANPSRVKSIDPSFGDLNLLDKSTGEEVSLTICLPNFIPLREAVEINSNGKYRLSLTFDLNDIHTIAGREQLDLTEAVAVLEPF